MKNHNKIVVGFLFAFAFVFSISSFSQTEKALAGSSLLTEDQSASVTSSISSSYASATPSYANQTSAGIQVTSTVTKNVPGTLNLTYDLTAQGLPSIGKWVLQIACSPGVSSKSVVALGDLGPIEPGGIVDGRIELPSCNATTTLAVGYTSMKIPLAFEDTGNATATVAVKAIAYNVYYRQIGSGSVTNSVLINQNVALPSKTSVVTVVSSSSTPQKTSTQVFLGGSLFDQTWRTAAITLP